MISVSLLRSLDFILANQNPDGGWGYGRGRASFVEPTGLCVLALHSRGAEAAAGRGLGFLKACQKDSGAVAIDPRATDGSWMAYAALLAFHELDAAAEERRLRDWILGFEDASKRFTAADVKAIAAQMRYDASIPGWSWTPGTTAWVEPTSLFIIALRRTGIPATEKRIQFGIDLLFDRKVPSGGWNFGNPYSKSYELEASLMSTALALAALGAAGISEHRPAISDGLRFLTRSLGGDVSTACLAWVLLALKSFPSAAVHVSGTAARLAGLQTDSAGFRGNLFETALAFLVLSDASILGSTSGSRR